MNNIKNLSISEDGSIPGMVLILKFRQVLRPDYITCSRCESVRSELMTQLKSHLT